jgi:hypothetical protein
MFHLQGDDGSGDGLEVTQIVITAATPMSEERKSFPGDAILEEDEEEEEIQIPKKAPFVPTEIPLVVEEEAFADFTQMGESNVPESVPAEGIDSESELQLSSQGQGASNIQPKKTSLDIEDKESRFLRGESGESQSPVTPEELDLHNLAKLESLKESDA